MPTDKPRTMITFNDKDLYEQVESYRFEHRFKSQNMALISLINKGIEALTGEKLPDPEEEDVPCLEELSDEEKRFLDAYRNAEPIYKGVALEILEAHPATAQKNRA